MSELFLVEIPTAVQSRFTREFWAIPVEKKPSPIQPLGSGSLEGRSSFRTKDASEYILLEPRTLLFGLIRSLIGSIDNLPMFMRDPISDPLPTVRRLGKEPVGIYCLIVEYSCSIKDSTDTVNVNLEVDADFRQLRLVSFDLKSTGAKVRPLGAIASVAFGILPTSIN
jgi:hypothetical protein